MWIWRISTVGFIGVVLGILWAVWAYLLVPLGMPSLSFMQLVGIYVFVSGVRLLWSIPIAQWANKEIGR